LRHLKRMAEEVYDLVGGRVPSGYMSRKPVGMGADGTPTHMVDRVTEDAIIKYVEGEGLPLNILSEEAGFIDRGHALTLIIDPLDGTYNALHGIPFYSVVLAVTSGSLQRVSHGVVMNLASGDLYEAERGRGAFMNARRISVRSFEEAHSLFSLYIGRRASRRVHEALHIPRRVRSLGSAALEMAMVAQGESDLFVYEGEGCGILRIVDIAASYLLVLEAGGHVVGDELRPLDIPLDVGARRNVIAYGDERVMEVIGWASR